VLLDASGHIFGCPKALEPFEADLVFVEVSPCGQSVLGITHDGLCVVWSTSSSSVPINSSEPSSGGVPTGKSSGISSGLSVDTTVTDSAPFPDSLRWMWLPIVPFPVDTPPNYALETGGTSTRTVEGDDFGSFTPSAPSPLAGLRRAVSKAGSMFAKKRTTKYQPAGPSLVSAVHWARVSDGGSSVVVAFTPTEASGHPVVPTVIVWDGSIGLCASDLWKVVRLTPYVPNPPALSRPCSSMLDCAIVQSTIHGHRAVFLDVQTNASEHSTQVVSVSGGHRAPHSSPPLHIVSWSFSLGSGLFTRVCLHVNNQFVSIMFVCPQRSCLNFGGFRVTGCHKC
jgi:hypothetical protein